MKAPQIFREGIKRTGSFANGFTTVFSSLRLLSKHKGLILYFIVPFILNVAILSGIYYASYSFIKPWLYDLIEGGGWLFSFLRIVLAPALLIILAVITSLLYSIVGNIVTAPFNDFLSYSIEVREANINFDEPFSLKVIIADIVRMTLNIVKMLGILLLINILLFALNLIPVLGNLLYTVLSFMASTFFLGFQFFDFPLERRRFDFGGKLKIAWRFKFMTMGLGTGFMLTTFIPILGFLGLNMATMGATTLFLAHMRPALMLNADERAAISDGSPLS